MPVIEMFVPQGTVDAKAKRRLHERVGRQVLEVEGATYDEAPLAQAITWMLIHEMPEGSWSVGSAVLSDADEPRVLTRVVVPQGAMDDERRAAIASRVNAEIVDVLGDTLADPTRSICVLDDSSTFSGGGMVASFDQIMSWIRSDGDREAVGA